MRPPSRVALLLGKPPRPGTIIAEVRDMLEASGIPTSTVLPHKPRQRVDTSHPGLAGADLVLHRGLSEAVHPLLQELSELGVTLCNPWAGTRDRSALRDALAGAGIPTPAARRVTQWPEVLQLARGGPVVVKATGGGRGSGVVAGRAAPPGLEAADPPWPPGSAMAATAHQMLPDEPPAPGPYLVEQWIQHDGTDRKLYVAGDVVFGLLKPSTLIGEHTTEGHPFPVTPPLRDLALAAAAALDLHLAGVDVVEGPEGLWVVDVNPFPGFRSVEGAAVAITEHLVRHPGHR